GVDDGVVDSQALFQDWNRPLEEKASIVQIAKVVKNRSEVCAGLRGFVGVFAQCPHVCIHRSFDLSLGGLELRKLLQRGAKIDAQVRNVLVICAEPADANVERFLEKVASSFEHA